jgi:hypothetical protein
MVLMQYLGNRVGVGVHYLLNRGTATAFTLWTPAVTLDRYTLTTLLNFTIPAFKWQGIE